MPQKRKPKPVTMKCLRCDHSWVSSLGRDPKQCPKCHSTSWNKLPVSRMDEVKRIDSLMQEVKEVTNAKLAATTPVELEAVSQKQPGLAETKELKQAKPFNWKILWYIVGTVLICGSIPLVPLWFSNQNQILGMLIIGMFGGGAYLIYSQMRNKETTSDDVIVVHDEEGKPKKVKRGKVNSLNIYAEVDPFSNEVVPRLIDFEWTDNPRGQPKRCLNTKDSVFVNIWHIEKQELYPFNLPDAKYADPNIVARYIEQPASKRYFSEQPSLAQYIGIAVLGLMNGLGLFVIFILSS